MRVVVGHANPDFDAYAATVAATKLFEDACGVFLGSQNANVRQFHNLHEEFLSFVDLRGLDLDEVDALVMVDTRDPDRIGELEPVARRLGPSVIVYDHHPHQEGDLEGADDRSMEVGATTSILVHELRRRGVEVSPLEASVMLLGIHEDTGSLTYPGSTAYDADAAAWLMANGADMEVLNQFLSRTLDPAQRALLAQLEESLEVWDVNGQPVAVGVAQADEYVDSASVLTHYVVEDMGHRVAIGIVRMPERLQIVARSRLSEVDVGAVMTRLGGGGHAQAASAGFRDLSIPDAVERVREALTLEVKAPLQARAIMSFPVRSIGPDATMRQAGELMARWGHGGLPVVADGVLRGLVTRKDVDKAARHGLGHAPVTGFMGHELVTVSPDADLTQLERLLATRGIGRVPVCEDGALVGIVTRKDVLRAEHGDAYLDQGLATAHAQATRAFHAGVEALLPPDVRAVLDRLGELAQRHHERAHLVGGFVRDMLVGRPNLDLDIVVEGDGIAFAEAAADVLGGRVKAHRRFGTAVVVLGRHLHVDVASSRTEFYVRPGALPTVERSTLRQDLFRRDFTINAMAACIDPGCVGRIADPFGGLTDLERGVVRVLHALSFVEDPTRVMRAARFETRYGFKMDEKTESLARRAVELGLLDEVSGARIREELTGILDEDDPGACLLRLLDLGALSELVPAGARAKSVAVEVRAIDDALGAVGGLFARQVSRRKALVAAMATSGSADDVERWLRHYRFGREYAEVALVLARRAAAANKTIQNRRTLRDSTLFRTLAPFSAEAMVVLWARTDAQGRQRIERYVSELSHLRPAVDGRDLIAMGATPGEAFTAILARARDDRLDGKAVGREAELANLRRLALRAGLLASAKDRP